MKCFICEKNDNLELNSEYKLEIESDKKFFKNPKIYRCNNCDFSFVHPLPNNQDLDFFYKEMGQQDMICIDTEFDWRKTYFPKLSLVQISTKKNIFLIDFLKIKPSNFLKQILDNKDILKFD